MPRAVTYALLDVSDGRFGVVATLAPDRVYRRDDFPTLAEAEAWIEGLRALMAACGAPVVRAVEGTAESAAESTAESGSGSASTPRPSGRGRRQPRSVSD